MTVVGAIEADEAQHAAEQHRRAVDDLGCGGGADPLHEHVELADAGEADREGVGVGVSEPGALRRAVGGEDLAAQVVDGCIEQPPDTLPIALPGGRGALPLTPTMVARAKGRPSPHHAPYEVAAIDALDTGLRSGPDPENVGLDTFGTR